jgi:hypothetical protein
MAKSHYEVGIEKLDRAAGEVSVMEEEQVAMQPKLVVAANEVQELVAQVQTDSADVAEVSDLLISKYFMKFYEDFNGNFFCQFFYNKNLIALVQDIQSFIDLSSRSIYIDVGYVIGKGKMQ